MTYPKFLTSSVDPEKLALTVKGILVALIPVILMVAGVAHWNLGQEQLTQTVDAIATAITAVGAAISAVMILVGVVRKIIVAMGGVAPQPPQS